MLNQVKGSDQIAAYIKEEGRQILSDLFNAFVNGLKSGSVNVYTAWHQIDPVTRVVTDATSAAADVLM